MIHPVKTIEQVLAIALLHDPMQVREPKKEKKGVRSKTKDMMTKKKSLETRNNDLHVE